MTFTVIITTAPNVSLGRVRHHTWTLPTERHMLNLARAISRKPNTSVVYTYDNDGIPHTHMCKGA